jgi:hypothetical protein
VGRAIQSGTSSQGFWGFAAYGSALSGGGNLGAIMVLLPCLSSVMPLEAGRLQAINFFERLHLVFNPRKEILQKMILGRTIPRSIIQKSVLMIA